MTTSKVVLALCLAWLAEVSFAAALSETFIVYRGEPAPAIVLEISALSSPPGAVALEVSADPTGTLHHSATGQSGSSSIYTPGKYEAVCKDHSPNSTGFEIHTPDGFLGWATCEDLKPKCHNWLNSSHVQKACPKTCFVCDPNQSVYREGPACYDSSVTGVKFKNGPEARCIDLANYCNHTTLYYHVQAACRLTCGLCDAHVGHVSGKCHDLKAHEQPEFRISGDIAECSDLADFCGGVDSAYLIRHKCPRTCGACPDQNPKSDQPEHPGIESAKNAEESNYDAKPGGDPTDCDRRRRWGFCATRRRRNM